jgi:phenylalanyl-tRNA synthetase alpha chain
LVLADIERIVSESEAALRAATTPDGVEEVRRNSIGRKGALTALFGRLASLPADQRGTIGARINAAQRAVQTAIDARAAELQQGSSEQRLREERIDVTLPGRYAPLGRRHILRRTMDEVVGIFIGLGFEYVEGTEIESDEFNFGRLNMPPDHPARDDQDSFYLGHDLMLRTHSTVVDAHVMEGRTPPMRVVTTGRCYRRDAVDSTHMPVFHQVDGFMVGERITFADLKGVLAAFAREMFGRETKTRFQPGFFPFTEPSAELAVTFEGRWLELGGCGMFHPRVLEMAGIDPERHTAFAFGLGVDRQVMVRYGIPDIRLFWENDLRLLRQF